MQHGGMHVGAAGASAYATSGQPSAASPTGPSSSIPTKITEIIGKSACVAWCPVKSHAEVIALGAKESGGLTGFEDTGGCLELYDVSFSNGSENADATPRLLGSIKTAARFSSVSWTSYTGGGSDSSNPTFPLGVLAGGMTDGNVHIFDPNEIIGKHSDTVGNALLGTVANQQQQQQSSGSGKLAVPVQAMEFSPLDPHRLCTGAANGHISVVDISTAPNLTSMEPGGPRTSNTMEITAVAWNTSVAHIVATSSADGSVTVWDLNANKAWCELRAEQQGQAVSDIRWNPVQGLHLLTASSDDRNPVIRIWDLSASTTMPLGTLSGHRAGILKTSWCPHDESLLLSCGKDNRTILWDLHNLLPIAELPTDAMASTAPSRQSQTNAAGNPGALFSTAAVGGGGLHEQKHMRYNVQWSPLKRGLALTCSLDKKIQIHTVQTLVTKSGRPPAWMKPASSVSVGFGGTIVSVFKNPDSSDPRKFVLMQNSILEKPNLVETSQRFETDLVSTTMIDFCHNQQVKHKGTDSEELWGFMQVVFETDARQKLLEHLGFNAEDIAAAAEVRINSKDDVAVANTGGTNEYAAGMDDETKEMVKRALIIGNFEAAVECCFRSGSLADALILASCGGAELWTKTQERFFACESPKRPFLSMVRGIIRGQLDDMVNESNLADWQDTLAVLSTYGQADDFARLCVALGDRLQQMGDGKSASLCYMCALNLDRSVEYWKAQLEEVTTSTGIFSARNNAVSEDDLLALHEFIVKVSVFMQASSSVSATLSEEVEEFFTTYAQALADNGLYVTATKYVKGSSERARILRDRLYRSRASQGCYQILGQPPEFPYQMVAIEQSRGQVIVQPTKKQPESVSESPATATNGFGSLPSLQQDQQQQPDGGIQQQAVYAEQQQQSYNGQQQQSSNYAGQDSQQQQQYAGNQQLYGYDNSQQLSYSAQDVSSADQLPPGWMSLQDPGSGMTYYYNQTTGETTWDRPISQVQSSEPLSRQDSGMDTSSRSGATSRTKAASMVSKYGDGFVTSASHPELADQYGNVGTSNPYTGTSRPGIARVEEKPPVSGNLNFDKLQLSEHHHSIKDNLLAVTENLKQTNLNPVEKRQVADSEKGVAILVKKLALGEVSDNSVEKVYEMVAALSSRDYANALSIQTQLANIEWRDHKDWLKGLKVLITLASKKC